MVFIILGFGISLIVKHREKSINLFIASVGTGIYYLIDFVGAVLIEHRFIPLPLGVWLPNIVVALTGIILIFKYANTR